MRIGRSNFSAGETTRRRVDPEHPAVMQRISGWDPSSGALIPENMVAVESGTGLGATCPEQQPFAYRHAGATRLLVRDKDENLRVLSSAGAWGSSQGNVPVIADSRPFRVGAQVIFPSDGPMPRVWAYEPDSPSGSTNLRPLSLKSPGDYQAGWRPVVTPSAFAGTKLFANNEGGGNAWTSSQAGANEVSVSEAAGSATFTIGVSAEAGELAAKELSSGVSLKGKVFLVFDILIRDDPQLYQIAGLFPNNTLQLPSGYELVLYESGPTEIARYAIPRLAADGKVHRVAINIGNHQDKTVTNVGIEAATYWTKPAEGTYTITLYDGTFSNDWSHKGNYLMPAVQYKTSPWAETLNALIVDKTLTVELPSGVNLVTNGGFESALTSNWTTHGDVDRRSTMPRSGARCIELDHANDSIETTAAITGLTPGDEYQLDVWYLSPDTDRQDAGVWRIQVDWYTSVPALVSTDYGPGPLVTDTYVERPSSIYRQKSMRLTVPATADRCKIHIEVEQGSGGQTYFRDFRVDDISLCKLNQAMQGCATVLTATDPDKSPAIPRLKYYASYAGRNLLGETNWSWMVSNASEASSPEICADPWRTYSLDLSMPADGVATIDPTPTAGGSGYAVGDVLDIVETDPLTGEGATALVSEVNAGAVTELTLLTRGDGYTAASGKATAGGSGTGCTVEILTLTDEAPLDEYGDYLSRYLVYRRIGLPLDGEIVWDGTTYIGDTAAEADAAFTDTGQEVDAWIEDRTVPATIEMYADYLESARHGAYSKGRVWLGCLDWNEALAKWERPLSIAVSTDGSPWAFPTGIGGERAYTDGCEIDMSGYAVTGSEIRAIIPKGDDIFVFLDSEVFLAIGDNPVTGWWFRKIAGIGLISERTLRDCGRALIWSDGQHFYAFAGAPEIISKDRVDCTLIDWDEPHNAVFLGDKYRLYCDYDGEPSVITYDLQTGGWRIRPSDAYALAGICEDTAGGTVYGLRTDGYAVDLYGSSTTDYGATGNTAVREAWTQYVALANGHDMRVKCADFEIIAPANVDVDVEINGIGAKSDQHTETINVTTSQTRYRVKFNMLASAVEIKASYSGSTPPSIYLIGLETDEPPART